MALGNMFKKVFVPQNEETHVGTPENTGMAAPPPQPEQPAPNAAQNPEDTPGAENQTTPTQDEGAQMEGAEENASTQNIDIPPAPAAQHAQQEFHYSAFDEENESTLWNQHTRIVLAIAVVLFSAMILWWILI